MEFDPVDLAIFDYVTTAIQEQLIIEGLCSDKQTRIFALITDNSRFFAFSVLDLHPTKGD